MGRAPHWIGLGKRLIALLAVVIVTCGGCARPTQPTVLLTEPSVQPNHLIGEVAEVSPPETLVTLKQIIDAYTPQVRILSPRPGEILEGTAVTVRLQVRGLPLFKDATWQLGPHLHLFLDDQPYQAVYDLSEPIVLDNLSPGTHTLRVFASRPWHESFKNQGAFDQRTFHVFAQTPQREVNASAPLLTYSRPQGTYGAEPIMLDFYLTNAPLHLSAQADGNDTLTDWRVRCTINGQSFVFDQWQPIYLKGFKPGRNWLQLELIDAQGQAIDNPFNNTVRIIDYQPGGEDTLAKLVRGELGLEQVLGIVDPTYTPPLLAKPEAAEPEETSPAAILETGEEPAQVGAEAEIQAEEIDALPDNSGQDFSGTILPAPSSEASPPPSAAELDTAPPETEEELAPPTGAEPDQEAAVVTPLSPSLIEAEPAPVAESGLTTTTSQPELEATTPEQPSIPEVQDDQSASESTQTEANLGRQDRLRRRSSRLPGYPGPRDHGRLDYNQPKVAPEQLAPEPNLTPPLPKLDSTEQELDPGETEGQMPLEPLVINLEQPYI